MDSFYPMINVSIKAEVEPIDSIEEKESLLKFITAEFPDNYIMHGYGLFKSKNGQLDTGYWNLNKLNGRTKVQLTDGGRYEGEWLDNRIKSLGINTTVDGDRYIGQ